MWYHSLYKVLPASVKQAVRNAYYLSKIKNASIDQEIELKIISKLLESGNVAIDIGANYGLYTRFLAEFCNPGGEVHAFEPLSGMYKSLKSGTSKLKLAGIHTYNLALSNKSGKGGDSCTSI